MSLPVSVLAGVLAKFSGRRRRRVKMLTALGEL